MARHRWVPFALVLALLFSLGAATSAGASTCNCVVTTGFLSNLRPALATLNGNVYLAWTGTDRNHNLNVTVSTNRGMNFLDPPAAPFAGQGRNTDFGPALAAFNGALYIAWTGTDSNHHINIASSTDGVHFGNQVTPFAAQGRNTDFAPALTVFHGRLYVAWTGTDSQHLNVASSVDGIHFGNQVTPFPGSNNTTNAPALATFAGPSQPAGGLVLGWSSTDSNHTLAFSSSPDGVNFLTPVGFVPNNSIDGLALQGAPACAVTMVAWTGTDSHQTVNLGHSSDGTHYTAASLQQESPNAPAITLVGTDFLIVAWTSTISSHPIDLTFAMLGSGTGTPGC
jgi:hypothetical protein